MWPAMADSPQVGISPTTETERGVMSMRFRTSTVTEARGHSACQFPPERLLRMLVSRTSIITRVIHTQQPTGHPQQQAVR